MKKMTVVSGKGGTGKTSLVASFAALAGKEAILVDADVDAANLSLITGAKILEAYDFSASQIASIDPDKCNNCGLCRDLCRFEAVSEYPDIDPTSCEGCAFCANICPQDAVDMFNKVSGNWFVSQTKYGFLVHARLGIAEDNSGKLVTAIRGKAEELAFSEDKKFLIVDGPPGIGCPVIASLAGADTALIVTEPTVSAFHDLQRVLAVCRHFDVPAVACINRYDLDTGKSLEIENYCRHEKIELVGKIPFDRVFVEALVSKVPVCDYSSGPAVLRINEIWQRLSSL